MRIQEILEAISRRDFLKYGAAGAAAGALATATSNVLAKGGGQHLPYEFEPEVGQKWAKLPADQQAIWKQRQQNLFVRAKKVLYRIMSIVPESDRNYMRGIKIDVPLTYALYDIANVGKDKLISIDLGTFWDLSDDCLGYAIGHEMGHIYYDAIKKHPFGRTWQTPELRRLKVQSELDCDTYGAKLAFAAGFNPTEAYKQFSEESKRERYDPNKPGYNYYPDYRMRDTNFKKTIDQLKNPTPAEQPPAAGTQIQNTEQPRPDQQAMFKHIMRGIFQLA